MSLYHQGSRRLQDRFDTRRLADRIEERIVSDTIDADDRAFIERCDMLFIATVDGHGHPNCSYKGGDPGFVRVLDERNIAFPGYDGNGMYLSFGNVLVNPQVGLLFISFEEQKRLVERSRFVPKATCETPVPAWKRREWARDALPEKDRARSAPPHEVLEA